MSRSHSRYGTFYESQGSSTTELTNTDYEHQQKDIVSEINLSYILDESHGERQDWLVKNRLPLLYSSVLHWLADKGNLGIIITLNITIIGVFMMSITTYNSSMRTLAQYLVSCGMFGVLGGLVNWIALKILFIKVPGIYGSGIFARCHQDILQSLRRILQTVFCDQSFLEFYAERNARQHIVLFNIERHLQQILHSETVEQIINKELHALSKSSEGQILAMIGIRITALRPLLRPYIMNIAVDIIPGLLDNLAAKDVIGNAVQQEIVRYLSQEGTKVGPTQVTHFVKQLVYKHLSWLVITGCIVGVLMGIISQLTSIARLL